MSLIQVRVIKRLGLFYPQRKVFGLFWLDFKDSYFGMVPERFGTQSEAKWYLDQLRYDRSQAAKDKEEESQKDKVLWTGEI